jgi:hypothetical protein
MHTLHYLNSTHFAVRHPLGPWETLLFFRQQPIVLLALSIAWPLVFYFYFKKADRSLRDLDAG